MSPRIIVLGGGESGCGVALLARAEGYAVRVSDAGSLSASAKAELEAAGIPYEEGGHSRDDVDELDLAVKSPGIPWGADYVAFAKTRGVRVLGEMEFCACFAERRHASLRRIGITGSNGKTTTTLLTTHLLEATGLRVAAGGNIGVSYARLLLTPAAFDWVVLELSSFQLEDIERFGVDVGTVLNLSPDHLDRYGGSFEEYAQAKYRLCRTQGAGDFWLQAGDALSRKHAEHALRGGRSAATTVLMPAEYRAGVAVTPERVYDLRDAPLPGAHNAANASFALAAAELAGAAPEVLAKALGSFENAPHRLEHVGYVRGVAYVNDSKATNVDAAAKALGSFDAPIVWIVGGEDKGNDYALVADHLPRLRAVVALGLDNGKIVDAFADTGIPVFDTHALNIAIVKATEAAKRGDVVLLSPACASFDLFRNYIDRGDQFRAAVRALPGFGETLATKS